MSRKRRRKLDSEVEVRNSKRCKGSTQDTTAEYPIVSLYYPKVSSLRGYLLSRFPRSAKSRRKRIDSIAQWSSSAGRGLSDDRITRGSTTENGLREPVKEDLSKLLDTTIVGYGADTQRVAHSLQQQQDVEMLSQKLHSSVKSDNSNAAITQHEVCSSTLGLFLSSKKKLEIKIDMLTLNQACRCCSRISVAQSLPTHKEANACIMQRAQT